MDLLGSDQEDATPHELKISQKFAAKYEKLKKMEDMKKAMLVSSSESDSEVDDEDAALLTEKVEGKILDTLAKIRNRDPSLKKVGEVFTEQDFEEATVERAEKRMTFKDHFRETLLKDGPDAIARAEEELEARAKKKTPLQEQEDLKKAFLDAADGVDSEEEDDLFSMKNKTAEERAAEEQDYQKWSKTRKVAEMDVLNRIYAPNEDLNETDEFLRDYLQNKRWIADNSLQAKPESTDSEDEHLEQQEEFEHKYNHRFEEEGGAHIQSHARNVKDSVRQKDNTRSRKRAERMERKQEEKRSMAEELKRLKNIRKQEIKKRLETLRAVTGNAELDFDETALEGDFNPEEHDQQVEALLGEGFEEQDEKLGSELLKNPEGVHEVFNDAVDGAWGDYEADAEAGDQEWDAEAGEQDWAADGAEAPAEGDEAPAEPSWKGERWDGEEWEADGWGASAEDGGGEHATGSGEPQDGGADGEPDWWFCDECHRPIPGGAKRFDCTVCADFTLCTKCFRAKGHKHRMRRLKTPKDKMPPEEMKGQLYIPEKDPDVADEDKAIIEEAASRLDYEDIIAGDLPTRFKYVKVPARTYNMTAEYILKTDDKVLNAQVGIKKLAPYRTEADEWNDKWGRFGSFWQTPEGRAKGRGRGKESKAAWKKGKKGRQTAPNPEWTDKKLHTRIENDEAPKEKKKKRQAAEGDAESGAPPTKRKKKQKTE